jgi:peptide/nickel transport system ATP-binding protein
MAEPLLSVKNLTTTFFTEGGRLRAVEDVSFDVQAGQTLAVVGESGCGKSVAALSILRLLPIPPAEIEGGQVWFEGRDLLQLPEGALRSVRGDGISVVFQEPMAALNPVYTVGSQIMQAVRMHRKLGRRAARQRAIDLLRRVEVPSPAEHVEAYPHELSSGMRQRVMIAMALSCGPKLIIADEPTRALDVTIQAQILDLFRRLQDEQGMSIIFITHDLGVVAEFASDVVVMYAGRVVEAAPVRRLFVDPLHPYTQGLLASVPPRAGSRAVGRSERLRSIDGVAPSLAKLGPGCRFADRCARRARQPQGYERCSVEEPELVSLPDGRSCRCHFCEPGHDTRAD